MTNSTDVRGPGEAAAGAGTTANLRRLFFASLQSLRLWYERSSQRRRLAQLDDHLLRDIGIDRVAAMEEAYKPFWRD